MSSHNPVKTFLSVASCRLTRWCLRVLKRGGTSFPGMVACFFDKKILEVVSDGMEIIVVTGTNGKTTTCSMLRNAFQEKGIEPLSNVSGANLLSGITAEFTSQATLGGKPKRKFAIVECDEAALKHVVPLIHPKVIVVTNLFRDQLDRYGEVMTTLEELRKGIKLVPETRLCLNADCSLTASLAKDVPNPIYYYGIGDLKLDAAEEALSDAKYCINCGTEYKYDFHTYAHLGGFVCPKCGYKRMKPDMEVVAINNSTSKGSNITIEYTPQHRDKLAHTGEVDRLKADVEIGLPALYNVYNAIAAIGAFAAAGWKKELMFESLAKINSSFGRMENFRYNGTDIQVILVKNPAGCNQSLTYLSSLGEDYTAVFCLNDRTADGHDISWVWDADYEKVAEDPYCKEIYLSGTRAKDMKVRLKYAGTSEDRLYIIENSRKLIKKMTEAKRPVFVLPNYTAMLDLRSALGAMTGKKEFWKDQK